MKRILTLSLAALGLLVIGCSKDGGGSNPAGTTETVIGSWHYVAEDDAMEWEFKADNTYFKEEMMQKEEGTFSVAGGKITLVCTKEWERDWVREPVHGGPLLDENGNYQYTDWKENANPDKTPVSYGLEMMYDNDVMLWLAEVNEKGDGELVTSRVPFIRQNATAAALSNVNSIQGKWYWYMFGDTEVVRAAIIINGNKGEIIITPWSERYTGSVRYEKGVLYLDNVSSYTCRYSDNPENPYDWKEHVIAGHPEDSPWRAKGEGGAYGLGGTIRYAFIPDGNKAYSVLANLVAEFNKQ